MRLLQTEVDVVPGRKPQKQPLPEGFVGQGTVTLRIQNSTPRQNSYTVRLKCEEPYWQDAWYTLAALPPTGDPQNNPPTGKPDQPPERVAHREPKRLTRLQRTRDSPRPLPAALQPANQRRPISNQLAVVHGLSRH